jgi:uncharacterized membrane protein YgdD (TMEM256/DUF423 family)
VNRALALAATILGFTGVALGAVGAHALKRSVEGLPDAAERLAWWETGARYHLFHALALFGLAVLAAHVPSRLTRGAGVLFVLGIALFSGSLYALALSGNKAFAMATPLGGVSFMAGWVLAALAASKLPRS